MKRKQREEESWFSALGSVQHFSGSALGKGASFAAPTDPVSRDLAAQVLVLFHCSQDRRSLDLCQPEKRDMDGGCQDSRSPRSIRADAPDAKTARNLPARPSGTGGTGMAVRFKTQDQWQSRETMPGDPIASVVPWKAASSWFHVSSTAAVGQRGGEIESAAACIEGGLLLADSLAVMHCRSFLARCPFGSTESEESIA